MENASNVSAVFENKKANIFDLIDLSGSQQLILKLNVICTKRAISRINLHRQDNINDTNIDFARSCC